MLIRGGMVVDAAGERVADLRTGEDGHVIEVAADLQPLPGEQVHDATGKLVIPGGVDAHTHLHMPVGAVRVSDDFVSGTRAAAIGGTTTIIDYVTVARGDDPMKTVATWHSWAEPSVIDWGLHLTFTEAVPESVIAAGVEAGIPSFKLYLAYPDRLQVDDATIVRLMRSARRQGALVTLHCENGGAIEELRREALAAGRTGVFEHALTRPAVLEAEAVNRAAALAEVTGASIYIVHVSSAPALAAVRAAQERGVDVKAETCPQYLYLDSSRFAAPTESTSSAPPRCGTLGMPRSFGRGWQVAMCTPSPLITVRSGVPTGGRVFRAAPAELATSQTFPVAFPVSRPA